MPRFDGTGPEGTGSNTGWGDGDCTDKDLDDTVQDKDAISRRRPLRRRAFKLRRRRARFGGRGRRGPARRR